MVSMAGWSLWKGIHTAPERAYRTLRVVPLIGRSSTEPVYRLYDGESAGDVEITEVSEAGSVPDIRVKNRGRRLLLIDGQELLGAKQNRILNTDVLVAADADVVIPVSCVEAGRWGYRGKLFSPGKMMYSSGRASKSESVARSLRMGAGPNADQGEVWKKINQLLRKLRVSSDSSEMHAAYAQRDEDLQEIRAALELPEDTVGVAVYDGDRLLGLDLFDRAPTLARHWKLLVDSYAIEWLAVSEAGQAPEAGSDLLNRSSNYSNRRPFHQDQPWGKPS